MKVFAIATESRFSSARSVRQLMAMVLLALAPGIAISTMLFGAGVFIQIFLALLFALSFEAAMLKLRAQPIALFLTDLSAPLTAVLFALLVPPSAPWWIAAVGMGVAIIFAKHLHGGLGRNLFNPAMAGFAAARIFFPQEFSLSLRLAGITTVDDFTGYGNEWLALAYAVGGIFLLRKKIIPWQTPVATLAAAILVITAFRLIYPGGSQTPTYSMLPAVWLLGAFFIVTDPVTGCISTRGRLVFGAGVGALGASMGIWQDDTSGLAFAILLMNCLAPWIDRQSWAKVRRQTPGPMDANA